MEILIKKYIFIYIVWRIYVNIFCVEIIFMWGGLMKLLEYMMNCCVIC